MGVPPVQFTNSCGNRLIDFCDHYLHFGRRYNTVYELKKGSRVLVGKDAPEKLLLTIVRIASWATVIFPLVAMGIKLIVKVKQEKPTGLQPWTEHSPYGNDEGRGLKLREQFWKCLTKSKLEQIGYKRIFPLVTRDVCHQLFDDDAPYVARFSDPKKDEIAVIITGTREMSLDYAKAQSEQYGPAFCLLSPKDSFAAYFNSTPFSPAFKKVLTNPLNP